jgi:transcriptional regulator with XRE-family HTH domain
MAPPLGRTTSEEEIGLVLILLRSVRGWNQDDLAKASGVRNSSISDFERGRKVPGLETLKRLLEALEYPWAAIDLSRRYVETLRASVHVRSPLMAEPTAAGGSQLSEVAVGWEIEQAATDLASAVGRFVKLVLVLLQRGSAPCTEEESTSSGLPRPSSTPSQSAERDRGKGVA